jgi:hypothetical protein
MGSIENSKNALRNMVVANSARQSVPDPVAFRFGAETTAEITLAEPSSLTEPT